MADSQSKEFFRVIGSINTFAESMAEAVERNAGLHIGTVENLRTAKEALEIAIAEMREAVELLSVNDKEVAAGWLQKCLEYNLEALDDIDKKLEQYPPE